MAVQSQGCTPAAAYRRRRPTETLLYRMVQNHLETFLALCRDDWEEERISPHAKRELRRYLDCGILAHGFARARCDECGHDFLVAFSCKGRAVCPACNTRRRQPKPRRISSIMSCRRSAGTPVGLVPSKAATLLPAA